MSCRFIYKFYDQLLHKAISMLLHGLATYCSHHQGAIILKRHEVDCMLASGKYIGINFLQQLIDVQYH